MAALSLANMLALVKRVVPTVTLDTELQDAILQRMNYLATLDFFPFQQTDTTNLSLTAAAVNVNTPDNFASVISLRITTNGYERTLQYLDPSAFYSMFPDPSMSAAEEPRYFTIGVAESTFVFNCPADQTYTLTCLHYTIPDDASGTTVSQLSELAKLTIVAWAAADGFRMMKEFDRADQMERDGDKKLMALKRRYQLSREEGACFISQKAAFKGYQGY